MCCSYACYTSFCSSTQILYTYRYIYIYIWHIYMCQILPSCTSAVWILWVISQERKRMTVLMSPGEVWCNGYGQMHFGYLITCHYTVQVPFAVSFQKTALLFIFSVLSIMIPGYDSNGFDLCKPSLFLTFYVWGRKCFNACSIEKNKQRWLFKQIYSK